MILRSGRRHGMIIEATVLVVGEKDNRILPVRAAAHRVDDLRNVGLAALNVGWRMLIIFARGPRQAKIGIDE